MHPDKIPGGLSEEDKQHQRILTTALFKYLSNARDQLVQKVQEGRRGSDESVTLACALVSLKTHLTISVKATMIQTLRLRSTRC